MNKHVGGKKDQSLACHTSKLTRWAAEMQRNQNFDAKHNQQFSTEAIQNANLH